MKIVYKSEALLIDPRTPNGLWSDAMWRAFDRPVIGSTIEDLLARWVDAIDLPLRTVCFGDPPRCG